MKGHGIFVKEQIEHKIDHRKHMKWANEVHKHTIPRIKMIMAYISKYPKCDGQLRLPRELIIRNRRKNNV